MVLLIHVLVEINAPAFWKKIDTLQSWIICKHMQNPLYPLILPKPNLLPIPHHLTNIGREISDTL